MKNMLTMAALLATLSLSAQSAQQAKPSVGGYGAGLAEITTVNGRVALNVGGHGGVLLNHKWMIGASGHNIFFEQKEATGYRDFQFAYYGIMTEYRFKPSARVHAAIGVTAGGGFLQQKIYTNNNGGERNVSWVKDGHWTAVVHPTVSLNVKLLSFMQARAHVGYRFTGDVDATKYNGNRLNGVGAGVGLAFGAF